MSDELYDYPVEYEIIGKTVKFVSYDVAEQAVIMIFTDETMFRIQSREDDFLFVFQTGPKED